MANLINWLEIPVSDFDRAKTFYESALSAQIQVDEKMAPGFKMGLIYTPNMARTDIGGALVLGEGYVPGSNNTLVYLNANETGGVDGFLERVKNAGGTVLSDKIFISEEIGYCAFFMDSEGNKLGVHSSK